MSITPDRPRVLVLDAQAPDRELVEAALGRHCDLVALENPLHIFEHLELFEPDLLIMDLALPMVSGLELISLIRQQPTSREQRILVFSQQNETEVQKHAYRLGVQHFQAKPCRPSQLFKGAAAFFRLAGGRLPEKRHELDVVRMLLAEVVEREELHPLLQDAVALHAQARRTLDPAARRLVAQVARARAL